jgi:hypothetical protein
MKCHTLLLVLLFVGSRVIAQTYQFKYVVGGTVSYKSAENVLFVDDIAKLVLGDVRKKMYENQYYVGFQNDRYLDYHIDYSDISGKTFKDTMIIDGSGLWEMRYKDSVQMVSNTTLPIIPQASSIKDLKSQLKCRYIDDSLRSCWYDAQESFNITTDTQTINGWLCTKWVPNSKDLQGRVWVWISKEVPIQINLGLGFDGFDGGLVKMEWENGRYNLLMSYEQANDYEFDKHKLKPKLAKKEVITQAHILRSALYDDFKVNIKTEHKYE